MDKRLWYKMLGKEDAYNRSAYYKINEREAPIKLKNLIGKKSNVKEFISPADTTEYTPDGQYVLRRKTTGDYYKSGNIRAPKITDNKSEAAIMSGRQIKDMEYNWKLSWDAISLDDTSLGEERVNEIMIPKDIEDEIKKSISMGFDRIVTGMISPKRKGIMLVNKKNQVRGTYDLKLKDAVQQMIDAKNENINELAFTGEMLKKVKADLLDFLSKEHKKLGYANPLDTYHLVQQMLDSQDIHSKIKGIR